MSAALPGDSPLEVLAAVRRCLDDLVAFEGPLSIVPPARGAAPEPPAADAPAGKLAAESVPASGDPDAATALESLRREVGACQRCRLAAGRRQAVLGSGDPQAGILFVGEAPGEEEDLQGEPFVGAAGQLLTRIIAAMKLCREQVYICNVVKCRPPGNRVPEEDEVTECAPFLRRQIALVRPRVICALGRTAAQALLRTGDPIGRLRGATHEFEGIPVVCTYHPAALLRRPEYKRATWDDIKRLRREYDGVEL